MKKTIKFFKKFCNIRKLTPKLYEVETPFYIRNNDTLSFFIDGKGGVITDDGQTENEMQMSGFENINIKELVKKYAPSMNIETGGGIS